MRYELMLYLKDFSDPGFQREYWLGSPEGSERQFETLGNAVKEVIDMRGFSDETYIDAHIGIELFDQYEADTIKVFCRCLMDVVDELKSAPPRAYLDHPGWPSVVYAAKSAYDLLRQG